MLFIYIYIVSLESWEQFRKCCSEGSRDVMWCRLVMPAQECPILLICIGDHPYKICIYYILLICTVWYYYINCIYSIILCFITLYYITLYYITLYYITYISLHSLHVLTHHCTSSYIQCGSMHFATTGLPIREVDGREQLLGLCHGLFSVIGCKKHTLKKHSDI